MTPLLDSRGPVIVLSIVGARPEFIQAAPVTVALRGRCREVLVHTGQHYDDEMSAVFFRDLDLPLPDRNLNVGSSSQAEQTARVIERVEKVIEELRPHVMLLRSDTNSTLGAALAAAKLMLPIIKIEAGMRSFDRSMPEEINRLVADHLADLLLCSTETARNNLKREGIDRAIHVVGDVHLDAIHAYLPLARARSNALQRFRLEPCRYVLATVHRAGNTDDSTRLRRIVRGVNRAPLPVVFPVHPRTASALVRGGIALDGAVRPIPPVSYLDMLVLIENASVVATDSGGIQREAYMLGRPCVTMRPNTEWVETVSLGWNVLVDDDSERIAAAIESFRPAGERPDIFGDGRAAFRIADLLVAFAADRPRVVAASAAS